MKKRSTYILCSLSYFLIGCFSNYLELRPNGRKVVPESIADFQALLDNSSNMNYVSSLNLGIISGDEYTVNENRWNLITAATQRNAFVWNTDIFEGEESTDWNQAYHRILISNIVIEGLKNVNVDENNKRQREETVGRALFHRSLAFYELAQLFCDVYQKKTSHSLLGIPIKLNSNVNISTNRSTIEETYQQIIFDLKASISMLPNRDLVKERPVKQAAMALLSRVYLQMSDYQNALEFATLALGQGGELIKYDTIDSNLPYSFSFRGVDNSEVIYTSRITNPTILSSTNFVASPNFLALFGENDYRRKLFFNWTNPSRIGFKGSYYGSSAFFTGLGVDELYLIKAEALVRTGKSQEAKNILSEFRASRYHKNTLPDIADSELLSIIFLERKKQLFARGIYWSDLKRLNLEQNYQTKLKRKLLNKEYELMPLDPKYVFPIPDNALSFGGLVQNIR